MAKFLTYALSILLVASFNAAIPSFRGVVPNLLFLLVIFYALRKDDVDFLWIAFFSGLLLDTLGGNLFGVYTVSFLLIGFIVNYATRTMFTADPSLRFVAVVVVVSYVLLVGLLYIGNGVGVSLHIAAHGISPLYLQQKVWLDLIFDLIFALPVYLLTTWNDSIIMKYQKQRHG